MIYLTQVYTSENSLQCFSDTGTSLVHCSATKLPTTGKWWKSATYTNILHLFVFIFLIENFNLTHIPACNFIINLSNTFDSIFSSAVAFESTVLLSTLLPHSSKYRNFLAFFKLLSPQRIIDGAIKLRSR